MKENEMKENETKENETKQDAAKSHKKNRPGKTTFPGRPIKTKQKTISK